ncbi:DUF262 domain-containing protein [Aliarcobacter cryaerophilus]|uniref:DUF262 domain-containing protein n=1 Tax=Aliarcobacter cryaerophilus TaxID=28198 RepID=UPI003DA514C5
MDNNFLDNRVGTLTIEELFEKNLKVPRYQRPYSWQEEQVIDLIEDLSFAFSAKKDKYLIGNMIFHQEEAKEEINIVDGQQRITTLALILKVINEESCKIEFLREELNSLSYKSIVENYKLIQSRFQNYKDHVEFSRFINEKVIITYIKANTLDEAFMLFDSQNTRGKPLDRKDLLKVHHIRFINSYEKQKTVAENWEQITKKCSEENKFDNVDFVLNNLAFIRKAIRQELIGEDLVYVDVFKEFIAEGEITILNNYNQPPIFENFDFNLNSREISLISKSFDLKGFLKIGNGLEFLPFEIIQSIEGGERFFWFVLKYVELIKNLKSKKTLFNQLDGISGNGNLFLKKIYQSILILFVDKFGLDDFDEFAIKVFILLLNFRQKEQVRKEGVVKFEWEKEKKLDLYKLIFLKFSSKSVIKEIDKYIEYFISNIEELKTGTKAEFFNKFESHRKEIRKILGKKYGQQN